MYLKTDSNFISMNRSWMRLQSTAIVLEVSSTLAG
jgi:hypothetical protein